MLGSLFPSFSQATVIMAPVHFAIVKFAFGLPAYSAILGMAGLDKP